MGGTLASDLGIGPDVWLLGTMLLSLTLFFKLARFWSLRNLDLILLFAIAPGLMMLVGRPGQPTWSAFVWLFVGSMLWLIRCLLDLGLARRPLLEPNLNFDGLSCLSIGLIGLFVAETISLPIGGMISRNPAEPKAAAAPLAPPHEAAVEKVIHDAPLPSALKSDEKPAIVLRRVLACLGHIGLVAGLIAVGWTHFERPIAGVSMATAYLLLPYSRIALVDSGQLLPAACIVAAVVWYARPALAGLLIGLAAGWMPACVGLIPLWAGFYWRRGFGRFLGVAAATAAACGLLGRSVPALGAWARVLGARSLGEAGLLPRIDPPTGDSFWAEIDPIYRIPVLIAYFAMVAAVSWFPTRKNLGELIALSAALLVASQFWYLDAGGTLVLLYLPLLILMMFRPNLAAKVAIPHAARPRTAARPAPIA